MVRAPSGPRPVSEWPSLLRLRLPERSDPQTVAAAVTIGERNQIFFNLRSAAARPLKASCLSARIFNMSLALLLQ
jgi:hypothetical protein